METLIQDIRFGIRSLLKHRAFTAIAAMTLALGAASGDVMRMILTQGLWLTLGGLVIGIGAAIGLTRFLRELLFEVTPTDPATYVAVSLLLIGVAIAACLSPARRATRVDPLVALRYE